MEFVAAIFGTWFADRSLSILPGPVRGADGPLGPQHPDPVHRDRRRHRVHARTDTETIAGPMGSGSHPGGRRAGRPPMTAGSGHRRPAVLWHRARPVFALTALLSPDAVRHNVTALLLGHARRRRYRRRLHLAAALPRHGDCPSVVRGAVGAELVAGAHRGVLRFPVPMAALVSRAARP